MAKKDFLSELANDIHTKKRGEEDKNFNGEDYNESSSMYEDMSEKIELASFIQEQEETLPEIQPQAAKFVKEQREPSAFDEEKRIKIDRPKKEISKTGMIAIIGCLLVIILSLWFFVFRATISVPDFVGKPISEVSTWAKQNKMESSAIAIGTPQFNLEYDKDIVIEQSVSAGKKIKKDTPITIIVSKGPDPDEKISFPEIKKMSQSEVEEWIKTNKLLKTKLNVKYNETVKSGEIVSYELKGGDETNFTRGSTLTIVASKGPAPAGQVTVENFAGKTYSEMELWARAKKVVLKRTDSFSDTVESEKIISIDRKNGETVKEGETITVVVSKGKGVVVPNLVGYTQEALDVWEKKNSSVLVVAKDKYSEHPKGTVIEQKTAAGTVIGNGDVVEITKSLYMPILDETSSREYIGKDYILLKNKVDEFNAKGANIQAGEYGDYKNSTCKNHTEPGQIIEYACYYGTSDLANGCGRPLNLNSRIAYRISTGPCDAFDENQNPSPDHPDKKPEDTVEDTGKSYAITNEEVKNLKSLLEFCNKNGIPYQQELEIITDGADVEVYKDDKKIAYTDFGGTIAISKNDVLKIKYKKNPNS